MLSGAEGTGFGGWEGYQLGIPPSTPWQRVGCPWVPPTSCWLQDEDPPSSTHAAPPASPRSPPQPQPLAQLCCCAAWRRFRPPCLVAMATPVEITLKSNETSRFLIGKQGEGSRAGQGGRGHGGVPMGWVRSCTGPQCHRDPEGLGHLGTPRCPQCQQCWGRVAPLPRWVPGPMGPPGWGIPVLHPLHVSRRGKTHRY